MTTATATKKGNRIFSPKKARAAAAALRRKKAELEGNNEELLKSASFQKKAKTTYKNISDVTITNAPTFEQIQQRAYELFLERNGQHGSDRGDWLQAEKELKAQV